MPASEWAAVSARRPVPAGAELSARGEKDGEGEGRAGGGEGSAGERLLGEASGQAVPADCPTPIERISHAYASLVRPAGARASVVT